MPSISNYSYQPNPRRWMHSGGSELDGPLEGEKYIGVELEVEAKNAYDCYDVAGMLPHADTLGYYLKQDGSLINGFEIVTHPRTLDRWIEDKSIWHDLFKRLVRDGMVSYDTGRCGLHMHLSKNHFTSAAHAVRFAAFFHQNPAFSYALSRREPENMSVYSQLRSTSSKMFEGLSFATWRMLMQAPVFDHHTCMSFSKYNTLEVRLFRGTLNTESFYGYLHFVRALVDYTSNTLLNKQSLDGFSTYCKEQYPSALRITELAQKRMLSKKNMNGLPKVSSTQNYRESDPSLLIGKKARERFNKKAALAKMLTSVFAKYYHRLDCGIAECLNNIISNAGAGYFGVGHRTASNEDAYHYWYERHDIYKIRVETIEGFTVKYRINPASWATLMENDILERLSEHGVTLKVHYIPGLYAPPMVINIDYHSGNLVNESINFRNSHVHLVPYDKELDIPITQNMFRDLEC